MKNFKYMTIAEAVASEDIVIGDRAVLMPLADDYSEVGGVHVGVREGFVVLLRFMHLRIERINTDTIGRGWWLPEGTNIDDLAGDPRRMMVSCPWVISYELGGIMRIEGGAETLAEAASVLLGAIAMTHYMQAVAASGEEE